MKSFEEVAGFSPFIFWEYNLKCLAGVAVGYLLYRAFPEQSGELLWVLLSILLSITHDNNSKVAYDRMKGNVVGSLVGLAAYFLHNPANLLTICLGVAASIAICSLLRLIGVVRTALVAYIIVVLYEESHSGWQGAVYRVASVLTGCFIGLVINNVFRRIALTLQPKPAGDAASIGQAKENSSSE
jgi:uncharacterized membrane protein YgaE (UPF0421/DUF939 family)